MNKYALLISAFLAFAVMNADAQKKRAIRQPASTPAAPERTVASEYEIDVDVIGGMMFVSVKPSPVLAEKVAFSKFFNDYLAATPLQEKNRRYPKIVLKFGADTPIKTLNERINLVRVSDKAVVELLAVGEDYVELNLSRKVMENEMINVKPNPLTLLVEMNDQKNLTLNNEEMGNLSDMSQLVTRLKDLYLEREKNGVFRENSNEIEKTIFIKMPLTASGADLIKIAKALQEAGADRIGFLVDETVPKRLELIDLPTIPRPKKKHP